jgi:hypothetical protein
LGFVAKTVTVLCLVHGINAAVRLPGARLDTSVYAIVCVTTTAVADRVVLGAASVVKLASIASPVKQNRGDEAYSQNGTEANKGYCGIIITIVGNEVGFGNRRS